MPARLLSVVGLVLIVLGLVQQATAEILCETWNSIVRDVKRRQCWPEPFVAPDRTTVRSPFAIQVANGWRRQNMLGEFHFQPNSEELTEAGRLKVRWILTVCPQQHRLIYVHMADTEEETALRMATVEKWASKIAPNSIPPILPTSISDDGWPASEIDMIGRKFQATMPDPRLPKSNDNGMSGGSSSSGGY